MKTSFTHFSAAAIALFVSSCAPETSEPADGRAGDSMSEMNMTSAAATANGLIMGSGKVTAVNAAAGTITIDHGPIPEVKWGPMTMSFSATDPAVLQDLKVGDTVSFQLKSAAEPSVVSSVQKQ